MWTVVTCIICIAALITQAVVIKNLEHELDLKYEEFKVIIFGKEIQKKFIDKENKDNEGNA